LELQQIWAILERKL